MGTFVDMSTQRKGQSGLRLQCQSTIFLDAMRIVSNAHFLLVDLVGVIQLQPGIQETVTCFPLNYFWLGIMIFIGLKGR